MVGKILKYVVFIGCIFLLCVIDAAGQSIKTREDLDEKSRKLYKKAISEGRKKRYKESLKLYDKLLKKHPEFIDGVLRKAGMMHNMKDFEGSAQVFQQAINMDPEYDPQMYFSLAIVNRDLKKFDVAADCFQDFIDRAKDPKRKQRAIEFRDRSRLMHTAYANPVPFEPVLMGGGINTSYSEVVPKMGIEGKEMIFTRKIYYGGWDGDEDFYVAHFEDGEVISVEEIKELNTESREGVHTLSADGNTIIFTYCNHRNTEVGGCDLYYSMKGQDGWKPPSSMGKVINSISWDGQPSLSTDGKKLFFSSGRQDGYGGNDIWMSTRTDTSGWTIPMVLPETINTSGNEESPFIHPDGHTLYFRSDKHPGMGGFDLFYSRYVDSTDTWSEPVNLGYPINTPGAEGALSVSLDGKQAYYTSDMAYLDDMSKANLDIYTFELYEEARPMPSTFIKAHIVDKNTKAPLSASYSIVPINGEMQEIGGKADANGNFISSLPTNMDYAFLVEHPGYLLYSESFALEGIREITDAFILEIELVPIVKNESEIEVSEPIVLNNIFFESGSVDLKAESGIELDRLANNLKVNKDLNIEIHGHTDNVGSEEDNLILSEGRAESVANALVERGILQERLSFKGFGETKPVDTNETEAGRKNNRRTEFVVKSNN